jgi:hypothetical protein
MTIFENGSTLSPSEKSVLKERELNQMEVIRNIFLSRPNENLSCEDIHRISQTRNLLSSTRRCCTNFYKSGFLVKDREHKKEGSYGVKIVCYRHEKLLDGMPQLQLALDC